MQVPAPDSSVLIGPVDPLWLMLACGALVILFVHAAAAKLMDRSLFPFETIRPTGLADPAGDKAFDEDDEDEACATPSATAAADEAAPITWVMLPPQTPPAR